MKHRLNSIYGLATVALLLLSNRPALGLILHPDGEPNLAIWTERPHQDIVGRWGYTGSCVVIWQNYVITTRHQSGGVNTAVEIDGVKYTVSQVWDHNNADLRVAKLQNANLTNIVGIYENADEVGKEMVIGGYGVGRGEPLQNSGITYGYGWSNSGNNVLRTGTNKIDGNENDNTLKGLTSDIIIADFDGPGEGEGTFYESIPASYDSGGGWFIKIRDRWKVAGLSRAVNAHYEEGHDGDPNYAVYQTWFRNRTDPNIPLSDYMDAVRISSYAQWIKSIVAGEVAGDLDGDGYVGFADLTIIARFWQSECQEPSWCWGADFEPDGDVDLKDVAEFINHWLQTDPVMEP